MTEIFCENSNRLLGVNCLHDIALLHHQQIKHLDNCIDEME